MKRLRWRFPFALVLAVPGGALCGFVTHHSGYGAWVVWFLVTMPLAALISVITDRLHRTLAVAACACAAASLFALNLQSYARHRGDPRQMFRDDIMFFVAWTAVSGGLAVAVASFVRRRYEKRFLSRSVKA